MAEYLLSVWHDDEYELDFSSEQARRQVAQVGKFNAELETASALVFGGGLQPASSASVIRAGETGVAVFDGPYVDSRPQIGGFWIIEAADHDSARQWGSRAAEACERPVEVRPFQGE